MGFLNTVKHFLGFESEDDYYDDDYYDEEETEDEESARVKRSSQQSAPKKTFSKVVPINPTSSSRIKIMRPSDINDSTNVANEIKEGRLVIFDVGQIDNEEARRIVDFITFGVNANTKVVGAEKIKHIKSGAIITSNHFNPVDTTIIRYGIKKARRYRMFIVSQDTNFAMKGFLGFLMRYADEIPVSKDKDYMERHFYRTLNNLLVNKKEYILIYPEQEMWFNYRKPRPPKRGAYFYAAKFNVPIISCFVEMKDMDKDDTEEFKRVKYVLHILDPIYPDPEKNERDNSFDMMKKDYEQKKAAYEQIYKRPLDYAFSDSDIAGWKGTTE